MIIAIVGAVAALATLPPLELPPEEPCIESDVDAASATMADDEVVSGKGLTVGQISGALKAFLPTTQRCLTSLITPSGPLMVEITVGCSGRVIDVQPLAGHSWDAEIASCVAGVLHYADFPAHDMPDGLTFTMPVAFTGGAKPPAPQEDAGNLARGWLADAPSVTDSQDAAVADAMAASDTKFEAEQAEKAARLERIEAENVARLAAEAAAADAKRIADAVADAEAARQAAALAQLKPKPVPPPPPVAVVAPPPQPPVAVVAPPPPPPVAVVAPPPPPPIAAVAPPPPPPVVASAAPTAPSMQVVIPTTVTIRSTRAGRPTARGSVGGYTAPPVVPLDEGETWESLREACHRGTAEACWRAGSLASVAVDAAPLLALGCEAKHLGSCVAHSELVLRADADLSLSCGSNSVFDACLSAHHAPSCVGVARLVSDPQRGCFDARKGRTALEISCPDANGAPLACRLLGDALVAGRGFDKDRTRATVSYGWACDSGNGEACLIKGDLLSKGVGVRRDDRAAVAALDKACVLGQIQGCLGAAVVLDEGTNLPRDAKRAMDLYETACHANVASACVGLGHLAEEGVRDGVDFATARAAYQQGWATGHAESGHNLARLLWQGLGGKKDKPLAKSISVAACQAGDTTACAGPRAL